MDDFEKYLLKAINFLKYRPRSEKELRVKLKEKKAPQEVIDRIVDSLIKQKFLNDHEFALWWVRQRNNFRPKSKRILSLELAQKGIDKEILQEVLASTDDEQKVDDLSQAKRLAEQRMRRLTGLPDKEVKKNITAFLGQRGYNWDTIKDVLQEIIKEEEC